MKKKSIIIGCLVLVVIVVIATSLFFSVSMKDEKENSQEIKFANQIYLEFNNDIDEGIKQLTNNTEYLKMTDEQKVSTVSEFLNLYKKAKIIKNVSYSEENKTFSFIYNTEEEQGSLGGISIKKFDTMFNLKIEEE